MEGGKKNIRFTIEDIRKYLDGELSGPEMQAMEKAALDDPFFADAIEGYEESRKQSVSFLSDLSDLRNRLTERTKQQKRKKGILIHLKWTVAASILIIAGATVFTFMYVTQKTNPAKIGNAAEQDSSVFKNRTLPGAASDTTGITQRNSASTDSVMKSIASDHPIAKEQIPNRKNAKSAMQRDLVSNADLKKSETSADIIYQKEYDSILHPNPNNKYNDKDSFPSPLSLTQEQVLSGKAAGVTITKGKKSSQNYIAGIVVNEKQEPISNAAVTLLHSNAGITTDSNGFFKFYLKNSDSVGRIAVNYIGYQSVLTELKADGSSINRIEMKPTSSSLNDVVVIGYSTEDKSEYESPGSAGFSRRQELSSSLPDSLINKHAAPSVGWTAFYQYAQANKKISSADSAIRGTEIVTFQVNSKGELSSFKIIESISPAHDAMIIHLIKTGPEWKISKGKKQTCRVKLDFK